VIDFLLELGIGFVYVVENACIRMVIYTYSYNKTKLLMKKTNKKTSLRKVYTKSKDFRVNLYFKGSSTNQLIQNMHKRYYHASRKLNYPEWLIALGKFFSFKFLITPSPTVATDPILPLKIGLIAVLKTLTNPYFWFVVGNVFLFNIIAGTTKKIMDVTAIVQLYNYIVTNPDSVHFLFTKYPTLTEFNLESAAMIQQLTLNELNLDQCELVIRWCCYSQTYMLKNVLIDTTNQFGAYSNELTFLVSNSL